jgi:hypothetical protein
MKNVCIIFNWTKFCKLIEPRNLGLEMGNFSTRAKEFSYQAEENNIENMVIGTQDQGLQSVTHFKSFKVCISNNRT